MAIYQITKEKIKREITDIAGKKRVWVEMPDGNWQMLKFSEDPTIAKIQAEVDKVIRSKEESEIKEI